MFAPVLLDALRVPKALIDISLHVTSFSWLPTAYAETVQETAGGPDVGTPPALCSAMDSWYQPLLNFMLVPSAVPLTIPKPVH